MREEAQKSFLDKIVERSSIQTTNEAERAANIVFRTLRDMMSNATDQKIEADLRTKASESEQKAAELWHDPNVMVAFFSRISPV